MSTAKIPMQKYEGVQALRAIGALLVVVFHATNALRDRIDHATWQFNGGASGVDLFFTISGFIMVVATQQYWVNGGPRAAGLFLERRLVRIVPLYWIATTLKLLMMIFIPALALNGGVEVWHTISSYLFIPEWNSKHENFPLLVPGWTLAFEMFFYLWFALALSLKRHPVYWLTPLFIGFAIFWSIFSPFDKAVMTLLQPRILEFCIGMWIGLAALNGRILPRTLARCLVLPALIALMFANKVVGEQFGDMPLVMWGIPSAMLVYAVVSLESVRGIWHNRVMQKLGDASYAIYLFHPFVVSVLVKVLAKLHLDTTMNLVIMIPVSLVVASVGGIVIHHLVEKPMLSYFRRRIGR